MICNMDNCTGCFACYNICPKRAIEMKEDKLGYIYPKINDSKCINCGLCKKVCPVLNKIELKEPIDCFAIRTTDSNILSHSSSGGIATLISKKIIENFGVVYGASFENNCEVNHIRIDSVKDLHKIQGSKYVHSYIKETYKNVKKDLLFGKTVLFIGTPCQVAGLKKYLIKEYNSLYTLDIICHGVPSQLFLKDEVMRIHNDLNVDRINFRDKKYKTMHFSIVENGHDVFSEKWEQSPYFYTFLKTITLRENCYTCRYATIKRCSDMTLGDFWGLSINSKFYNSKAKGVSVALPITKKGLEMLELIKDSTVYEQRPIEEAKNGNNQLNRPSDRGKKVAQFKDNYLVMKNFYKTYKKVFKLNLFKQIIKSNKIVSNMIEVKRKIKYGKK